MQFSGDLMELLFRGKNKSFGAYDLYRSYPKHIKRSMLILIGVVLSILVGYRIYDFVSSKVSFSNKKVYKAPTTLTAPPPLEDKQAPPPEAPPPPPPVAKQIKFDVPEIVKDALDQEAMKDIDKVIEDKGQISNVDVEGKVDDVPVDFVEPKGIEGGKSSEPLAWADVMPEFSGGEAKLMAFLRQNIKYPAQAIEADIQGTVVVEFVVEPDGSISNAKVLEGLGGGCSKEALRVVNKMPKWKPGIQAGNPVRVFFTLPIEFTLDE